MRITFQNVTKKINDITILNSLNFDINSKELLCILGPSGSGKTTILRSIIGLDVISSGQILFDDVVCAKDINPMNKVGIVFQNFNLFPHFTILENITYAAIKTLNYSKAQACAKAVTLLDKFQLAYKMHDFPKNLSGGQKQKVAICRAMMLDPEILLFDEPTSALDSNSIRGLINVINDLKSIITIVIVTHFVNFAKITADRIIFLDNGKILSDQKNDEFFTNPSSFAAKTFLENSIF